jgi:hypothetical protein
LRRSASKSVSCRFLRAPREVSVRRSGSVLIAEVPAPLWMVQGLRSRYYLLADALVPPRRSRRRARLNKSLAQVSSPLAPSDAHAPLRSRGRQRTFRLLCIQIARQLWQSLQAALPLPSPPRPLHHDLVDPNQFITRRRHRYRAAAVRTACSYHLRKVQFRQPGRTLPRIRLWPYQDRLRLRARLFRPWPATYLSLPASLCGMICETRSRP